MCDADTLPEPEPLRAAVVAARTSGLVHLPYTEYHWLGRDRSMPSFAPGCRAEECDFDLVNGACSGVYVDHAARLGSGTADRMSGSADGDSRMPRGTSRTRRCSGAAPVRHEGRVYALHHAAEIRAGHAVRGQRGADGALPRRVRRRDRRWLSWSRSRAVSTLEAIRARAAGRSRAMRPQASSIHGEVEHGSRAPRPARRRWRRSGRAPRRSRVRSIAAAPANWSVENGSTSSGTPCAERLGDGVVAAVGDGQPRRAPSIRTCGRYVAHEPVVRHRAERRGRGRAGRDRRAHARAARSASATRRSTSSRTERKLPKLT